LLFGKPASTTFAPAYTAMFMKYFRYYPWGMQLLLFLLMTLTFMSGIWVILFNLLPRITGVPFEALASVTPASSLAVRQALLGVQGIQSVAIFMLPALAFAYLSHPQPRWYLGLRAPAKPMHLLLVVLLMAGATPILMGVQYLISLFDFGKEVKDAQLASENMFVAMLNTTSPAGLVTRFLIMAVIPGIGEELFYRGILMRFARQRSRNMLIPILFSAAVFAYSHTNIYGYLSIFMAGMLLASIYYLTGSIWCSIVAHVFHNGLQLLLFYFSDTNGTTKVSLQVDPVPLSLLAAGIVVFAGAAWALWRTRQPLPANWATDFTPMELEELKQEKANRLF
jgi:hypothetical protein